MTGGQISPLMDVGDRATTAPYGQVEPPFDLCRLAEAAGASFVAEGTAANISPLERLIKQGIQHHGFSFIEAVVPCPTEYGKRNPPAGACRHAGRRAGSLGLGDQSGAKLSPEELEGKIVTGVLHHDPDCAGVSSDLRGCRRAGTGGRAAKPRRRRVAAVPTDEPAAACGLPADLAASVQPILTAGGPDQGEAKDDTSVERAGSSARSAERRSPKGRGLPARDVEPPDTVGLPCEGGE